MVAGGSAALEGERFRLAAREHESHADALTGQANHEPDAGARHRLLGEAKDHLRAAAECRRRAADFGRGAVGELKVAEALATLVPSGYFLLTDRRWPGSRTAQIDLIVVGPAGVFVIDAKSWTSVSIEAGRVLCGQADVTDDILALSQVAATVQQDLAETGLAPGEIHTLVTLCGRRGIDHELGPVRLLGDGDVVRHIAARGDRLDPATVDAVLVRTLALFPHVGPPAPTSPTVADTVEPAPDSLISEEEVRAHLLAGKALEPIEAWMSVLHPDQARLTRRSYGGPARVRGPAGTGKTVVGLHRAAHLARTQPGKVLFTTFVRSLPQVMRTHLHRMAPEVADRVEFTSVHQFAHQVLSQRGVLFTLSPWKAAQAWTAVWQKVGMPGPLGRSSAPMQYWRDEVLHVVKGRGLLRFEDYAALVRTGRGQGLQLEQRRAVWELYVAYAAELRRQGIVDFPDLILLAEKELQREPLAGYSAVVVDEAQDLSASMLRLLHSLVGNRPNGLLLIGDGQQALYPSGYRLGEVGISLAGRGEVLSSNYRNTREILEFAQRLVAGLTYDDVEGAVVAGDATTAVERRGPRPLQVWFDDVRDRDSRLVDHVRAVTREVGVGAGDVGVLCQSRRTVRLVGDALAAAGYPWLDLADYRGEVSDQIKVGTVHRAKGLEFKHVLLADVRADQVESSFAPEDDAARERWELERRALYVAATRARDGLWVAVM